LIHLPSPKELLRRLYQGHDPVIFRLSVIRLIGSIGFAVSIPFLSIYLHENLYISMTLIGAMLTTSGIVGALGATMGGSISDKIGRHKLLIWMLIGRSIAFAVIAWLVWTKQPFLIFSAVYILAAVMGTSIFPLMEAMIADVTPLSRRSDAYGLMRVAANLGWALGPAIGGLLVAGGFHLLFIVTSIALAASSLLVAFKMNETLVKDLESAEPPRLRTIFKDPHLFKFLFVCLLMFLTRGQLVSTLSMHASTNVGLSKSQIGMLFFINGAMVTAMQVWVTKRTAPVLPLRALALAGLLYGGGYFCVGLATGGTAMVAAMVIITIAEMIESPTSATYVTALAPAGMSGSYLGVYNLVMHLGWTVGPTVGGILLDFMPKPLYAWSAVASLAIISSIGFVILGRKSQADLLSGVPT
jgi:predicted MFS family arabinose efflux permease